MNVAKAGSKPTSFSFSPECLLFSFTLSTLTNDNNEGRNSLLAVFIISELMAGAALTVVTRSNDLWPMVRFKLHHLPERFLHVSGQSAKHRCLRATLEHLVLWLLWVQFLTRILKKSLFISRKKEINCGIFSHFSWVVFYILSPIFTEIKCATQKCWSYTIKMTSD